MFHSPNIPQCIHHLVTLEVKASLGQVYPLSNPLRVFDFNTTWIKGIEGILFSS